MKTYYTHQYTDFISKRVNDFNTLLYQIINLKGHAPYAMLISLSMPQATIKTKISYEKIY